jgi:hypothetical protein
MKTCSLLLALALAVTGLASCCSKTCCDRAGTTACCEHGAATTCCAKCGEIPGSPRCCKADAVKCPKCGMNAGSPGCCKMPK